MERLPATNLDIGIEQWLERLESETNFNSQECRQIAFHILECGDFQQRWDVAKIFPKLGPKVIQTLMNIAESEVAEIEQRWFAIKVLGNFPQSEVILTLAKILSNTESEDLGEVAAETLASFGEEAIAPLTYFLRRRGDRLLAAVALSKIPHPRIVDPLLELVGDENPQIRVIAISALASFAEERVYPVLIGALEDRASKVRQEAIIALGLKSNQLPEVDLVGLLKPHLQDFNLEVCQQTAIALSRVASPQASQALWEVLQLPTTPLPLQNSLIKALGWMETPEALSYLKMALNALDLPLISEIIRVLGRINPEGLKHQANAILIDWYHSHPTIAHDAAVKKELAYSWGQLKQQESIPLLQAFTEDRDPTVRFHAIASLQLTAP